MIHLIQTVLSSPSPFEWASQHIHMLGWGTIVVAAWKIATFFNEAKTRVLKAENQIDQMMTNHLPHIQQGTEELVVLAKVNNERLNTLIDILKG